MNLHALKAAVTSKAARSALHLSKHSPKILFVAGAVGFVGTVALACRATLRVSDILERHDKEFQNIVESSAAEFVATGADAPIIDYDKQKTKLKIHTALEIARLYAPAVGVGALSIAALTGSHVILSKRNGAALAAYATLDKAFKTYRQRVTDEYGKDVDRQFALNGGPVTVEEKTAEGTVKKTEKVEFPTKTSGHSPYPYAFLFDDKSRHFSREPGMNAHILSWKQNHMNDKLRTKGHVFLNEVLDELGIPRTPNGQLVGWVYRKDNEEKNGDNYISFGVWENDPEFVELFTDSNNPIWLDFNVDGPIFNLI